LGRHQHGRVIGTCPFTDNNEILDFGQTAAHPFSKKRVVVHNRYRDGCQAALSISSVKKNIRHRSIGYPTDMASNQKTSRETLEWRTKAFS
jgi:hypothetical protein